MGCSEECELIKFLWSYRVEVGGLVFRGTGVFVFMFLCVCGGGECSWVKWFESFYNFMILGFFKFFLEVIK